MNQILHENENDQELDRELDRLVDGELTADGYRQLVLRLERTPGGWRRCAIAFLQHQAWCHALASPGATSLGTGMGIDFAAAGVVGRELECRGAARERLSRRHGAVSRRGWTVAWALSLVGASLLSFAAADWIKGVNWPGQQVTDTSGNRDQTDESLAQSRPLAMDSSVANANAVDRRQALASDDSRNWGWWVRNGRTTADGNVELPLYEASHEQAQQLLRPESSSVAGWEAELRQAGHSVRRRWQYSTLQLPDGRDAVIPIEQVEIVPVVWP